MDQEDAQAKIRLSKILERQLTHHFSVAVESGKSGKRVCRLCGPIIYIVEPHDLAPKIQVYLPIWQYNMKKTKAHRTIILTSDIEEHTQIKLKTKNAKTAEVWYRNINQVTEEVRTLQLRNATHHVGINRDGQFPTVTMIMTNESFKFLYRGAMLCDLPRFPLINSVPVINDFQKIHVYKNGLVATTIRCENEAKARKILIILNTQTADVETVPEFFLVDHAGDVPAINLELEMGASGKEHEEDEEST
jgi:hypothetical protein